MSGENLNALLDIDTSNVEPEDVARESSDVCQGVTGIGDSQDPMHNQRPATINVSQVNDPN